MVIAIIPSEEIIYNYRHSRACRTIENAFSIPAARLGDFIEPHIHHKRLALHNYLRQEAGVPNA